MFHVEHFLADDDQIKIFFFLKIHLFAIKRKTRAFIWAMSNTTDDRDYWLKVIASLVTLNQKQNHLSNKADSDKSREQYRTLPCCIIRSQKVFPYTAGTELNKTHFFLVWFSKSSCCRFSSRSSDFKYTRLDEFAIVWAISLAASICLRVRKAGLFAIACPMSCALFASPWSYKERNQFGKEKFLEYSYTIQSLQNKYHNCVFPS